MSLLALAHNFCAENELTIAEFCRAFSDTACNSERSPGELLDGDKSSINTDYLHGHMGPLNGEHRELFARSFSLTDRDDEVCKQLRYCPSCISKGYHFAFHQLSWLANCPIHGAPIKDQCSCSKKVRYALIRSRRPTRQLCACGSLSLGQSPSLSPIEVSRLLWFIRNLETLRHNLSWELCGLRIDTCSPDKEEILTTYKLLRHVLSAMAEYREDIAVPDLVNCTLMGFLGSDSASAIDRLFEQYYSVSIPYTPISTNEDRVRSEAVAFFEMHLLGQGARRVARSLFQKNGRETGLCDELVDLATGVTTVRLLSDGYDGRPPVDSNGEPNFNVLAARYGQPVCLLWLRDDDRIGARAFYLKRVALDHSSWPAWISGFARYFLSRVVLNRFSPRVILRKLAQAEELQRYRNGFAFPSEVTNSTTQLDLFGQLGS